MGPPDPASAGPEAVGIFFSIFSGLDWSGQNLSHPGPQTPNVGENVHSRAKGDPKDKYLPSQDRSRGLRNPNWNFYFSPGILVVVLLLLLLLVAC